MRESILEVLTIAHIKGHEDVYAFKQKGPDYKNEPIKFLPSGQKYPNTRTIYFDLDFKKTNEPRIFIRDLLSQDRIKFDNVSYEVVTDEVILAKFALIQNMLSHKTRAVVALAKLQKLVDGDIELSLSEKITDKLYKVLDEVS